MTNRSSDKDPRQTWETIGEEDPYCGTGGPTRAEPKAGKFADPDSGLFGIIEPNASVLDVGCGYGRNSIPIADTKKASVVACDISLSMSRSVRDRVLPFILCDLRKLPFRDSSFDYLICSVVLIHLKRIEIDEAIAELKRVGRKCLIVMPNPVGRASLFGAIPLLVGPVMWIRKGWNSQLSVFSDIPCPRGYVVNFYLPWMFRALLKGHFDNVSLASAKTSRAPHPYLTDRVLYVCDKSAKIPSMTSDNSQALSVPSSSSATQSGRPSGP